MSGNLTANTVCNQVLKVLKESNLNYLVNETPYSAFVTIRKKFVGPREEQDISDVTLAANHLSFGDKVLAQENAALDHKYKGLESEIGHLKKDIDGLEQKIGDLAVEKNILEDQVCKLESETKSVNMRLEATKHQLSNQTDILEKVNEAKLALAFKLKEVEKKLNKHEQECKEKDNNLLVLQSTVENRSLEVQKLQNELQLAEQNVVKTPVVYTCKECRYSTESDEDSKIHMGELNEQICHHCNCNFADEKELKNHMCRIHVNNPSSELFYMKNWFARDKSVSHIKSRGCKSKSTSV